MNVFGLTERQHLRIQALRRDPEALFAHLAEERLPASVNHLFSALTGERTLADLWLPLVAASRVVLGLHFLSDVFAGSALGALIGGSVFVVLRG